jgi:iron complex transport system permease protein
VTRRRRAAVAAAALLAALAVGLAALALGTPVVPPWRVPAVLAAGSGLEHVVLTQLRAPRLALGAVAGAALGVAGLLLAEALRNPLAVPELLGVSSGAAAAVTITVVTGAAVPFAPLLPALLGAAAGGLLTLAAVRGAVGPSAVLLIGAGVSAALQAVLLAAAALADVRDQGVLLRYLLGSLSGTTWPAVAATLPGTVVGGLLAVAALPVLGVLRLGSDAASAAGVPAGPARAGVLAVACLLTASVVATCGPIAWTGFLGPQLAARLAPAAGLPTRAGLSAALGAGVVAVADLAARTALAPVELPVGGLTAVTGVLLGAALLAVRARAA